MRILIFGTGLSAKKVLKSLRTENAEIVAFVDNDYNKHGQKFENHLIISPNDIVKYDYEYIIIAIIKYKSVYEQLNGLGILKSCLIPYFSLDSIEMTGIREVLHTDLLLRDNYNKEMLRLENIIINMPFEIINKINSRQYGFPIVKSIDETVKKIIFDRVSISRYGDGEIKLIAGEDLGFQQYDKNLAIRLKQILKTSEANHIVGILNVFGDLGCYVDELKTYFREYLAVYNREFQYGLLDMKKVYYDAFMTRPYISYIDKSGAKEEFEAIRKIWQNRKVIIVEGDRSRLGVGNDLFENVNSLGRILCPNENAFSKYDDILKTVCKVDKECLIIIALGPTATVLAYDLSIIGYQAVDIGHIDIEYEWFKMGAVTKVVVENKFTNEAFGGNSSSIVCDDLYSRQIIDKVY